MNRRPIATKDGIRYATYLLRSNPIGDTESNQFQVSTRGEWRDASVHDLNSLGTTNLEREYIARGYEITCETASIEWLEGLTSDED